MPSTGKAVNSVPSTENKEVGKGCSSVDRVVANVHEAWVWSPALH